MSIISKISGIFHRKKEERPEPVEVKVVYAPPAKPGEPESEDRRRLLKHWLNKGEKPDNVVQMEKSMGSVLGTKTKLAILGKKTVGGAGAAIGAFGKGFTAGVRPVKVKRKKLTSYELGYRAGNKVRGNGKKSSAPPVSLSGFDSAFDSFDLGVPAPKKSTSRESKKQTLDEGFDTVFDGFKRFKW